MLFSRGAIKYNFIQGVIIMREITSEEMAFIEGGDLFRCIVGTIGMAGLGGLSGGVAGSAIPALGTGVGAALGTLFGGLVGAATFC
jgi:hypothetical protein